MLRRAPRRFCCSPDMTALISQHSSTVPLTEANRIAATEAEYFLEASTLRLLYYQADGPAVGPDGAQTRRHEEVLGATIRTATDEAISHLERIPTVNQQAVIKTAVLKLLNCELSGADHLMPGERAFWQDGELRLLRSILYRINSHLLPRLEEPAISEAAERCMLRNLSEGRLEAAEKLCGFLRPDFVRGRRMEVALKLFVISQLDQSPRKEFALPEFFQAFPLNIHSKALQMASEVQAALLRWRERGPGRQLAENR